MLEFKKDGLKAALVLAPTFILMLVFTFYPILRTLATAFMEGYMFGGKGGYEWNLWQILQGNPNEFSSTITVWTQYETGEYMKTQQQVFATTGIGFGVFEAVLTDPLFWRAMKNTVIMVLISVPVTIVISLLISVALNSIKKLQGFFQTIFFLPYVTNTIALGLVFSFLFSTNYGLVNTIIVALGGEKMAWINAVGDLSPTYGSCLFVLMVYTVWNGLAFKIMVFLSGMQSIDKQYYQAAQIDGTSKWRTFTKITVPLLGPMIIYITITSFIGAFKAYTSIISLFNGRFGPLNDDTMLITVVGYVYDSMKSISALNAISKASAASLILFAIIMLITLVQMQVNKRKIHY